MKRENWAFLKRVILLSLPVMIQQLLTNMLNLCDTMMIGGIGENAISAVAIVNKVFFVYQLILFGLSNGIGIFISQYMGARQEDQITDLYNFGLGLCCVMGILVTGILVIFPQPILGDQRGVPRHGSAGDSDGVRHDFLPGQHCFKRAADLWFIPLSALGSDRRSGRNDDRAVFGSGLFVLCLPQISAGAEATVKK